MAQQVGSIRGVVYDNDFDMPLAEARVTITETGQETFTNENGNYTFGEVPPGQYTLVFSREGFLRYVESGVLVREGQLSDIDARLDGDFAEMEEFVVQDIQLGGATAVGLLDLRIESPALIDSVGADLMSQAGAGDAEAGLKLVSGSTTTSEGFAAIRGLPPRYISTQLNGVVLPSANPDTRAVKLDLFPSDIIESIQVSKSFTPDQQGTASGGAVNIVTKSIPEQNFFKISFGVETNTNRPENGGFLVDARGPVKFSGVDNGRDLPGGLRGLTPGTSPILEPTRFGDAGPGYGNAPLEYNWSMTGGGRQELDTGVTVGFQATMFWEQDMSHRENAVNEERVISTVNPGAGMIPTTSDSSALGFLRPPEDDGDQILTSIFSETKSTHQVQWGTLGTVGLQSENHDLRITILHAQNTTSSASIADDTQGKHEKFPGHDRFDPTSPGGSNDGGDDFTNFAPYRRLETQEYIERTVQSLQFGGEHTLALGDAVDDRGWQMGELTWLVPVLDWNVSRSFSRRSEPGTLILDSRYNPANSISAVGSQESVGFEGAGGELGAFNVIFRDIEEDSAQYRLNLKFPFRQWSDEEGYFKIGIFNDFTEREYKQDTFTIPEGTQRFLFLEDFFGTRFSQALSNPDEFTDQLYDPFGGLIPGFAFDDPGDLIATPIDFQYTGEQDIDAIYWMVDLPVTSWLKFIGGMRFESTSLSTDIDPDTPTTEVYLDGPVLATIPGATPGTPVSVSSLPPGTLDADLSQDDILPSISMVLEPAEGLMVRAGYAHTIARPTFRELTPVSQSLYFGQTPFVGNPFLNMSEVKNYDLRVDYRPYRDTLFSVSYFYKDIKDHIQVVRQAQGSNSIVIPVNFPDGEINGWEFEVRQAMGRLYEPLQGLTIGGNATLLDTEVTLRDYEQDQLGRAGFPTETVRMTDAPEYLYNLYFTYNREELGTSFSLFYTVRGNTLVTTPGVRGDVNGAGGSPNFYIPAVYEEEYGTLNFTIAQRLGEYFQVKFAAKNLLDPDITTYYDNELNGGKTVKTSYKKGVDLSLGVSLDFEF
ncbi:TonB-dependent receptor [Mucisphaera calidilacus]|nr:TonB-dependent receptor [Mucisphaera calidilacus]